MSNLPDLRQGPVPLAVVRNAARRHILSAIDSRRGKKLLVLDPKISAYLGFLTEITLLREHGVERLLHLDSDSLGQVDVRSVIYFVRPTVANAQLVAKQVKDLNRAEAAHDVSVFFVPQRSILCERLFKVEGIYGDIAVADIPVFWVPHDTDVLSLELEGAFKQQVCDGDYSSLHHAAQALVQLQTLNGAARHVKGVGPAASALQGMLSRLQKDAPAAAQPSAAGRSIDTLVLLDRAVDLITPCCTQLTYEGLIDEVFGITNGTVQLDSGSQTNKQKMVLNSSDRLFAELRDASFAAVGPRLGEKARVIQTNYQGSKAQERTMAELKEFAGELKELPHISRHINLAEELARRVAVPSFRERINIEQSLLDGVSLDATCESIEELISNGEPLQTVLRLLALITLTTGGIPKKYFDPLRREMLHTYGHENIITLTRLQDAGIIRRQEGSRSHYSALKRALRLLVDGTDDRPPDDIAYTFSGYAPLSVRLVEQALRPGLSWGQIEDALKLLPGPHFETVQESGDAAAAAAAQPSNPGGHKRLVVVVFLGGVTFAEIAALRWLGNKPEMNAEFLVATTKLVNGSTLLASCTDPAVLPTMTQLV